MSDFLHNKGIQSPNFETFKEPMNRFQGTNSARLCSLAGRYDNHISSRFLAPIDCLKIPALVGEKFGVCLPSWGNIQNHNSPTLIWDIILTLDNLVPPSFYKNLIISREFCMCYAPMGFIIPDYVQKNYTNYECARRMPIGTIMAVVAVFEIHIERNIVGIMNPSIRSRGLVPLKQIYPNHRLRKLKGRSN